MEAQREAEAARMRRQRDALLEANLRGGHAAAPTPWKRTLAEAASADAARRPTVRVDGPTDARSLAAQPTVRLGAAASARPEARTLPEGRAPGQPPSRTPSRGQEMEVPAKWSSRSKGMLDAAMEGKTLHGGSSQRRAGELAGSSHLRASRSHELEFRKAGEAAKANPKSLLRLQDEDCDDDMGLRILGKFTMPDPNSTTRSVPMDDASKKRRRDELAERIRKSEEALRDKAKLASSKVRRPATLEKKKAALDGKALVHIALGGGDGEDRAARHKTRIPGSKFVAAFANNSEVARELGASGHEHEAEEEDEDRMLARFGTRAEHEAALLAAEDQLAVNFTAWHCGVCRTWTMSPATKCKMERHGVVRRTTKKRAFQCVKCSRRVSSIGDKKLLLNSCDKCGQYAWKAVSPLVTSPKLSHVAQAVVSAENFKPRGTEHAFSLKGA